MRTSSLSAALFSLAFLAVVAQGWAAEKEKKPLKYAGRVYMQVRAADDGKGVSGAKVQVLDNRVGKPELLSGTTNASGYCLVAAPVGYSAEEVDWERVRNTSIIGAILGGLTGGLNKKDCIVRFNGVAASITADGYKPFKGFIPYQDINGKAFEAVAQPLLLEKTASTAVSRVDAVSRIAEFEWLQCPDELPAGAKVPVKFRFQYNHPFPSELTVRGTAQSGKWQPIFDDGKHDDGAPADGIWGGTLQVPPVPKKGDPEVVLKTIIMVTAGERPVLSVSETAPFTFSGQSKEAVEKLIAARAARGNERLRLYEQALSLAPSCITILREYLRSALVIGQVDEAIALGDKKPNVCADAEAGASYVAALYRRGLYDRIVAHLAQAKLKPKQVSYDTVRQYYLGIALWKTGDVTKSVAALSALGVRTGIADFDEKLPEPKASRFKLGGTRYCFPESDSLFDRFVLVSDLDSAQVQAETSSLLQATYATSNWLTLGRLYLENGEYDKASSCLQRAPGQYTMSLDMVFDSPPITGSIILDEVLQPSQNEGSEKKYLVADVVAYCQDQRCLPKPVEGNLAQYSIDQVRQKIQETPRNWQLHHALALHLLRQASHPDTSKELSLAAWHGKSQSVTSDKMAVTPTSTMYGTSMINIAPVWTSTKLTVYNGYADASAQADFYISDICSSVPGFSFASGLPQLQNSTEDQELQPVYAYVVGRALTDIGCANLAVPFMGLALAQLSDSVEVHLAAAEMKLALGMQDEAAALQNKAQSLAPGDSTIAERIASMANGVKQN